MNARALVGACLALVSVGCGPTAPVPVPPAPVAAVPASAPGEPAAPQTGSSFTGTVRLDHPPATRPVHVTVFEADVWPVGSRAAWGIRRELTSFDAEAGATFTSPGVCRDGMRYLIRAESPERATAFLLFDATAPVTWAMDFVLEPGAAISGRVVSDSGVASDAVVLAVPADSRPIDAGQSLPIVGYDQPGLHSNPVATVDAPRWTRTDATGRFAIAGLWPGATYRIVAVAPGCAVASVTAESGRPVTVAELRLHSAQPARLLVADESGAAVEGATVEVAETMLQPRVVRRTDAQGRVSLTTLAPGRHTVTVTDHGFEVSEVRVLAGEAESGEEQRVVLRPERRGRRK